MGSEKQIFHAKDFELHPQGDWDIQYGKWIMYAGFYGNASSVDADLRIAEDNACLGLSINMSTNGGYMCELRRVNGRQLFVLLRRALQTVCVDYAYLDDAGAELKPNDVAHLSLACDTERVTACLNGSITLNHQHEHGAEVYLRGECGYTINPYMTCGCALDFSIAGRSMQKPVEPAPAAPEPYKYKLSLENLEEGRFPAEWTFADPEKADFQAVKGEFVSANAERAEGLIYQFDNDPTLHAAFSVGCLEERSKFGFILRKAPRTAFIEVEYDVGKGQWYLLDVPAQYDCQVNTVIGERCSIQCGRVYSVDIKAQRQSVSVWMDGTLVLAADQVRQTGYGKSGLFACFTEMRISELHIDFSSGVAPARGGFTRCADDTQFQGSMEVEIVNDGHLVGISKQAVYRSDDNGNTFANATREYEGADPKGYYQSVIKLHNGKFLQVLLCEGTEVQISDDLKTWTSIGRIVPDEYVELVKSLVFMTHPGSLTELRKPDGTYRLFFPMNKNTYRKKDVPLQPKGGHDTFCFYSDDGGVTWQHTDWISPLFKSFNGPEPIDWAESKVVSCADGSLRLYCSRNNSYYFSYLESFDFGETWHNVSIIPQMQCPRGSYGICEDPQHPGTWYAAWVNDRPQTRGAIFNRTRLSLARTRDGKNWEFLTDVERFGDRVPDDAPLGAPPLYQIIDPCVTVGNEYVYVTWGGSMWGSRSAQKAMEGVANPAALTYVHNELRPMFARFEKDSLQAQPWSAATVCDMRRLDCDLTKEKW